MMYKIVNGNCPEYLKNYVQLSKDTHKYNTRLANNKTIVIPKSRKNSGLRKFHASAIRLLNGLGN